MSFSRSLSGSKAVVLMALASVCAAVKTNDEASGASPEVIAGHQKQAEFGVKAVEAAIEQAPEGATITATIGGHSNGAADGNGDSAWVSIGWSISTPVAASEPAPTT